MSLLTIIQRAVREIGLSNSVTVVMGSTNQLIAELLEHAQQQGEAFPGMGDWRELRAEWTFSALAQETQTGALPADFDHFVNGTLWNRTMQRELATVSPEEWHRIKATSASPLLDAFYMRGRDVLMAPVPTAGHVLSGEYIRKAFATNAAGDTYRTAWTSDDDVSLLPEPLFVLGIAARYKMANGLDASDALQKFQGMLDAALATNKLKNVINMAGGGGVARGVYIPEGSWT